MDWLLLSYLSNRFTGRGWVDCNPKWHFLPIPCTPKALLAPGEDGCEDGFMGGPNQMKLMRGRARSCTSRSYPRFAMTQLLDACQEPVNNFELRIV